MNKPLPGAVLALLGVCSLASAAVCAETPPAKISLKDFPATTIENVVVPVPSEVFNALEKMGEDVLTDREEYVSASIVAFEKLA